MVVGATAYTAVSPNDFHPASITLPRVSGSPNELSSATRHIPAIVASVMVSPKMVTKVLQLLMVDIYQHGLLKNTWKDF